LRKKVIAIYPGSFDPPTNGHLDLIERGAKIFDVLIVAVLRNSAKTTPLFSVEERLSMLRKTTKKWDNVRIDAFAGLLVDYAVRCKAQVVLRGIRAVSDYEYELQMALMNRKLNKGLETMFMMPAGAYSYLSSGLVREISALGGSVCNLIPKVVERELKRKLAASSRKSKTKQE
jgi:pantetheine-phosphate adenylyltransferase